MVDRPMIQNHNKVWIVSAPRMGRFAFQRSGLKPVAATVREYRISAIGRYLISPAVLHVHKRLVGCKIHWQEAWFRRGVRRLRTCLGNKGPHPQSPLSLITDFPRPAFPANDLYLKGHIDRLCDSLRRLDSFHQAIEKVDLEQVAQVTGICEDDSGSRVSVAIQGKPAQQLDYIRQHVGREIDVRLKRALIADGLFEMKGFDYIHFDSNTQHRLLRFSHDGVPRACVLNDDFTIAFWLDDLKMVRYLQLFEHCIRHNHRMRESLNHCIEGRAIPLRLMFNNHLEVDYRQAPLPAVFQKAIGHADFADSSHRLIKQNLNHDQIGVSLNTVSRQESGISELRTHISIVQNLRALEPIKDRLPKLFTEMAKRSAHFEGGDFYLLESVCGVHHEG